MKLTHDAFILLLYTISKFKSLPRITTFWGVVRGVVRIFMTVLAKIVAQLFYIRFSQLIAHNEQLID